MCRLSITLPPVLPAMLTGTRVIVIPLVLGITSYYTLAVQASVPLAGTPSRIGVGHPATHHWQANPSSAVDSNLTGTPTSSWPGSWPWRAGPVRGRGLRRTADLWSRWHYQCHSCVQCSTAAVPASAWAGLSTSHGLKSTNTTF